MAYEVFTKKTPRMGNPVVSFSKLGQVAFNQFAARILEKRNVKFILLLWDGEAKKIALQAVPSDKKDPRAYQIRYNDKGNGASFSAKTFFDYIGVDYSNRTAIPVDINETGELIVEFAVPEELFAKKDLAHA
jgi:hypothetical protein